ncbi:hypothetical protein BJF79_09385 [Actinomadura sp. CNU-125]|uniref:SDR family NAD(P)-dependent oxidoreductase n=1 Tax=Actinomadura sp. CNU-125 TaxID=1904961 RepID=UPI00096A024F|nr:SDR family NAD(P)-dependent oxidoreductase [Actinomadura sp. CNU-125]OLT30797.1 hypothetical protein BJF79_09385 [Actinomadura sp. CNU-125]
MRLESGQVAVVTGAARGIGLALAEAFATRGMRVVLSDLRTEEVTAGASRVADGHGVETLAVTTDVRAPTPSKPSLKRPYPTPTDPPATVASGPHAGVSACMAGSIRRRLPDYAPTGMRYGAPIGVPVGHVLSVRVAPPI